MLSQDNKSWCYPPFLLTELSYQHLIPPPLGAWPSSGLNGVVAPGLGARIWWLMGCRPQGRGSFAEPILSAEVHGYHMAPNRKGNRRPLKIDQRVAGLCLPAPTIWPSLGRKRGRVRESLRMDRFPTPGEQS